MHLGIVFGLTYTDKIRMCRTESEEREGFVAECNWKRKNGDTGTLCYMEQVKPVCDLGRKMSPGI